MPWQEIKAPGDVVFKLPRVVLLDAIGKTVEVKYLVERGGKPPEAPSEALALTVLAQKLELPAPDTCPPGRQSKVQPQLSQYQGGDKVMIRWEVDPAIEPTLRESTLDVYKDGRSFLVKVDPTWPQADRRKTVFGSYSIEVGGSRLYSQVRSFKPD